MDQTLRNKMRARMEEVRAQVAERDELIEVIAIALLTRKNVFILGDTGQAKSYAINLFRAGITGTRQFERLMSKQTDEEALFGRLDLSSLIPGGVPAEVLEQDARYQGMRQALETRVNSAGGSGSVSYSDLVEEMEQYRKALSELHSAEPCIITKGKIPDSHICFLDEIFKASDGVLNALLTALNERRYTNEGKTIRIPTISFFSASNEIPNFNNPEEKILKPLYDRFELKVVTEYVEDRAARLAILKQKQTASNTQVPVSTISLAELEAMQAEVRNVLVPDSVNELMDDVLCELRGKGIAFRDCSLWTGRMFFVRCWLSGEHLESGELIRCGGEPPAGEISEEDAKSILFAAVWLLRAGKMFGLRGLSRRITELLHGEDMALLLSDASFRVTEKGSLSGESLFRLLVQANGLAAEDGSTDALLPALARYVRLRQDLAAAAFRR